MTRNYNRLETLENAIIDSENKEESFDFWEDNNYYGLEYYIDILCAFLVEQDEKEEERNRIMGF